MYKWHIQTDTLVTNRPTNKDALHLKMDMFAIYIRDFFFGQPWDSLTPGAVSQIHFFISSLILSYITGSAQHPEDVFTHVLKTPAAMYLARQKKLSNLVVNTTMFVYCHHIIKLLSLIFNQKFTKPCIILALNFYEIEWNQN